MTKIFSGKILLIILISVLNTVCKAGKLIIVSGNQHASIVISNNASPVEKYAAGELQRAISLMSGAELAIVNSEAAAKGVSIVIGTPQTNSKILGFANKLKLNGENEEQIAVLRYGNTLYLAGKTPRAALYAIYTFLEDFLGARWFWPGKSGEFIPKHKTITIDQLDIFEAPALKIRSLAITAGNGDPDTDTWMARNKLNNVSARPGSDIKSILLRREKGFQIRVAGHNIVLPAEMLKSHPEYIAEIGGKRQYNPGDAAQLCWSNPNVQNEVAKMISGWWDESPYPDMVHFYPADNQRYCQCAQCRAMGDVSTRWQKFSKIVISKVEKTHPGKSYWTYAYQGYKSVPQTAPAPFQFIGYTLYDASYRHLLSSGNNFNKLPLTEIDGWLKEGVSLGIRGYEYIIFKAPMFVPMVSWVVDQINWIHDKNMAGYLSELPAYGVPRDVPEENTYWTCSRMALYAATKAMWNTNLKPDSIVNDWCNKIYGPAAREMASYYWEIEKAWKENPKKISIFTNSPVSHVDEFLSPLLFQKLYGYFSKALTAIESLPDTARQNRIEGQITLEKKMLDNWQTIYNLKYLRANRYKTNIVKISGIQNAFSRLSAFEDKSRQVSKEQADISLGWNEKDLLFHIICHTQNGKTGYLIHDDKVLFGGGLDILLQPNCGKPDFMRFSINENGTISDAKTYGGINYDRSWNCEWTVLGSTENKEWVLSVSIPFASLGINPLDSTQFKMAIENRLIAGTGLSGWPDAFAGNSSDFGLVTLLNKKVEKKLPSIALYANGSDSSPLSIELQQKGWEVEVDSSERTIKHSVVENPSVLLIQYQNTDKIKFQLSNSFMSDDIKNYVDKGGILILAAEGEIPINKWFSKVPSVRWSGTKYAPVRRSSYVLPGEWLVHPNNISGLFDKGLSPVSGYIPVDTGWAILAEIPMISGVNAAFILAKKSGKGLLVLTSSPMGYYGGYDMFGNRNTQNVVKLIENLQAQLKYPSILGENQ